MAFAPVILWTDALLWLLAVAVTGYLWHCARRPHLAAPWRRVVPGSHDNSYLYTVCQRYDHHSRF